MVKQLTAINPKSTVVYRFIGKTIFLKCVNLEYASQLIAQIIKKGGRVRKSRSWLMCDIFGENKKFIFSGIEYNLEEMELSEVEEVVCNFYNNTLTKQGFKCKVEEI